jgi:Rrf2 family transcriptional regulator, cysteine metabolism repressor
MSTLLSKKTDYALLILSHLSERQGGGSAREIADRFGLSKAFLANILKELCQKGFLISHRGAKGGYSLQRPAEQVNLAELLESLEDGLQLTNCTSSDQSTHDCTVINMCPIRGPINEIHNRIFSVLRNATLAEVLKSSTPYGQSQGSGREADGSTFQPILSILNRPEAAPKVEHNPERQEQIA